MLYTTDGISAAAPGPLKKGLLFILPWDVSVLPIQTGLEVQKLIGQEMECLPHIMLQKTFISRPKGWIKKPTFQLVHIAQNPDTGIRTWEQEKYEKTKWDSRPSEPPIFFCMSFCFISQWVLNFRVSVKVIATPWLITLTVLKKIGNILKIRKWR